MTDAEPTTASKIILPESQPAEPAPDPAEVLRAQVEAVWAMSHEELVDATATLQHDNREIATSIQVNYNAALDPMAVIMQRIEALVLFALTPEQRARADFAFEQAVHTALQDAERQIRIQALTQGLTQGPPNPHLNGGRSPGRPHQ